MMIFAHKTSAEISEVYSVSLGHIFYKGSRLKYQEAQCQAI